MGWSQGSEPSNYHVLSPSRSPTHSPIEALAALPLMLTQSQSYTKPSIFRNCFLLYVEPPTFSSIHTMANVPSAKQILADEAKFNEMTEAAYNKAGGGASISKRAIKEVRSRSRLVFCLLSL